MKSDFLNCSLMEMQSEYALLLRKLFPEGATCYSNAMLDEINLFWLRKIDLVKTYLHYEFSKNNGYVFTASTYMDFDDLEHYPFLLLGTEHVLNDPLSRYAIVEVGNKDRVIPITLQKEIVRTARDNIKIIEKGFGRIFVLPLRLLHQDDSVDVFKVAESVFASLFSDINTIDEFFEKCKSINEITDHMKCGIEGRLLLSSSDDITLPFAERFKLARLETEKVMDPNQSDAFCFYTMVFGRIVQAMDVIMSCLEFECVPFIRDHVALSYVLSLIDGITDTPELQMIRYKMCISNLVYQLCDKETLNQNGYESFLQVVGSMHFDDMLFSTLKERGVDENHFDFKVSKEAVVKCLEKLYIEMS